MSTNYCRKIYRLRLKLGFYFIYSVYVSNSKTIFNENFAKNEDNGGF